MLRTLRPRLCALLLATTALHLTSAADAQAPAEPTADDDKLNRIRTLMREGIRYFDQRQFEQARDKFAEAFALERHYAIAASLAEAEMELGEYLRAAEHWRFHLSVLPPERQEARAKAEKQLAECESRLSRVLVTVNAEGAEIYVDNEPVGVAPLPRELWLAPGTHELYAQLGDRAAPPQLLDFNPGKRYEVTLALRPPAAKPASPKSLPAAPRPARAEAGGPSLVPAMVGAGLSVVALGVGIGFRLDAATERDRASELEGKLSSPSECRTQPSESCERIAERWRSYDRKVDISTASFIVAGASAALSAGYLLFWPRPSETRAAAVVTPESASVSVMGAF